MSNPANNGLHREHLNLPAFLAKSSLPLWRLLVFGLLVANLYMDKRYVPQEVYSADKSETAKWRREIRDNLHEINANFRVIAAEAKAEEHQNHRLDDYESRLRKLEGSL